MLRSLFLMASLSLATSIISHLSSTGRADVLAQRSIATEEGKNPCLLLTPQGCRACTATKEFEFKNRKYSCWWRQFESKRKRCQLWGKPVWEADRLREGEFPPESETPGHDCCMASPVTGVTAELWADPEYCNDDFSCKNGVEAFLRQSPIKKDEDGQEEMRIEDLPLAWVLYKWLLAETLPLRAMNLCTKLLPSLYPTMTKLYEPWVSTARDVCRLAGDNAAAAHARLWMGSQEDFMLGEGNTHGFTPVLGHYMILPLMKEAVAWINLRETAAKESNDPSKRYCDPGAPAS